MSMIGRSRPVYWKLKPVVIKVYSIARSSIIGKNYRYIHNFWNVFTLNISGLIDLSIY